MKILVVQTAFLGDTVFSSALVAALARKWPEARIELVTSPRGKDVALAMPAVAEVHVFDKRGADRGLAGLRRVASHLRGFDLAVVPHRSPRSALLAFLARVPRRVGFAGGLGAMLHTETVEPAAHGFLEREALLARHLGAEPQPMRLVPRPEWIAPLPEGQRFAGICLGSEWETKIWPLEHVAALLPLLRARGLVPVLLGGPREQALAAQLPGCIDTTGNSVGEAIAILARCALAVGGDTGLVHAARALSVPTVATFGPTPIDVHTFASRERAVSLHLECAPCSAHGQRRCPLVHHRCLRDLSPALVDAACAEVLA